MKIEGQDDLGIATISCLIPRGERMLSFTVCALPLTWDKISRKALPEPVPPRDYARKKGTNKLLRDDQGNPMVLEDTDDPTYVAALNERAELLTIWTVHDCLALDSKVSFDNNKPDDGSVQAITTWLNAIREELNTAGFTAGDLSLIVQKCFECCNVIPKRVEEARQGFLLKTQGLKKIGVSRKTPHEPSTT